MLKRILVGYDGTDQALRALEFTLMLAEGQSTLEPLTVHLVYVVEKPAGLADPVPDEVMNALAQNGNEILADGSRIVKKRLENPVTHLEFGYAAEKILELADKLSPDLVVVGMTRHPLSERIIGTVSTTFYRARRYSMLGVP